MFRPTQDQPRLAHTCQAEGPISEPFHWKFSNSRSSSSSFPVGASITQCISLQLYFYAI
nr:hypothetical protein Iba_chr09dCG9840 [Ipomoea batatas]